MMICAVCGYRSADPRGTCRRCGATLTATLEKTLGQDVPSEVPPDAEETRAQVGPGDRPAADAAAPDVVVELDESLEDEGEALRRRALTAGDRDPRHATARETPAARPPAPDEPPAPVPGPAEAPRTGWRPPAPPASQAAPVAAPAAVPPAGRAYAGFWIRLLAMIVDLTILGAVIIPATIAALLLAGGPGAVIDPTTVRTQFPWLPPLITLFEVVLTALYFVYFTGAIGATPGKAVLRLKVLRADGQPIGFGPASVRLLGYGLEMIPGVLLTGIVWVILAVSAAVLFLQPRGEATLVWLALGAIASLLIFAGFLWAAFDPRKQAWHDKLAGTIVVRVE